MDKGNITIGQAQAKMFALLNVEQMGDRVYEFAQDLFQKYIAFIEKSYKIDGVEEYLDIDEEWYDEIQEEFYQAVYDKINDFLKGIE